MTRTLSLAFKCVFSRPCSQTSGCSDGDWVNLTESSLLNLLVKYQINICYNPVGRIPFLGTVVNGLLELGQEVEAVVVDNL